MTFDSTALSVFRNAGLTGENAIATLQGGKVRQGGTYSGPLSALSRTDDEKAANNAVRTELLKTLGQAFELEGMTYRNGKVTFSEEFMDNLEKLLGKEVFKRADFGVSGPNGEVTSGRPLTNRRISAIMNKVILDCRGVFNTEDYSAKLERIKAQIEGIKDPDQKEAARKHFDMVGKGLVQLEHMKEGRLAFEENFDWTVAPPSDREIGAVARFAMTEPNGEKRELFMKDPIISYFQNTNNFGALIHLENTPHISTLQSMDPVKNYIENEITQFVKLSVDLWEDSRKAGIQNKYLGLLEHPGNCLEDRTGKLQSFREENGLLETGSPVAPAHGSDMSVEKCIGDEISVYIQNHPEAKERELEWKEVADHIKENLVGVKRPMVEVTGNEKDGYEFNLTGESRVLTPEDIDRIGPAALYTIYNG